MWKHDALMNYLVATCNSRLDQEVESCADDIAEKVTLRIEAKLKFGNIGKAMADGSADGKPNADKSSREDACPITPKQNAQLEAEQDE